MKRRFCSGMHVSTNADSLPHKQLKQLLPHVRHEGKPVTAMRFAQLCEEAREQGQEVFGLPGCDHMDERGYCRGWEVTDDDERTEGHHAST